MVQLWFVDSPECSTLAIVVTMQPSAKAVNKGQKRSELLTLVRLVLMMAALFLGLLGMHTIAHPAAAAHTSTTMSQHLHDADQQSHAQMSDDGGEGVTPDCKNCPMEHQMSAIGCVLALLVILLFVRKPLSVRIHHRIGQWLLPLRIREEFSLNGRPNLRALGISRT